MIVDIDHFKAVNDSHGHVFGDAVLAGVARTLHGAVRAGDVLARWGGEEFAVLVESSDDGSLIETAERLRVLVARSEVRQAGIAAKVRVSVGGTPARPEDTADSLFARADAALYSAKHAGRNRIEIDQPA